MYIEQRYNCTYHHTYRVYLFSQRVEPFRSPFKTTSIFPVSKEYSDVATEIKIKKLTFPSANTKPWRMTVRLFCLILPFSDWRSSVIFESEYCSVIMIDPRMNTSQPALMINMTLICLIPTTFLMVKQ